MRNTTNILSYFIKDIKDPIELAFYKNKTLFEITSRSIFNYILNIYNSRITNKIKCNYKISSYNHIKYLYYNHDRRIKTNNYNYISFDYICKKYIVKPIFEYVRNFITLLYTMAKYHNGFKYIIKKYHTGFKYTNNIILIMNKYELYYHNKFFNLYFGLLKGINRFNKVILFIYKFINH